ncbi:hypothetical protein ABZZ80_42600 [Streptomyces sp. NPDC006356]
MVAHEPEPTGPTGQVMNTHQSLVTTPDTQTVSSSAAPLRRLTVPMPARMPGPTVVVRLPPT